LSATTNPGGYREAPTLPDVLPAPKERGKVMGFIYRHPTIVVGGTLVGIMILIALLAPFLAAGRRGFVQERRTPRTATLRMPDRLDNEDGDQSLRRVV